jgi:hypothetical protein
VPQRNEPPSEGARDLSDPPYQRGIGGEALAEGITFLSSGGPERFFGSPNRCSDLSESIDRNISRDAIKEQQCRWEHDVDSTT